MPATFGRLEAKVTVPVGGWAFTMSVDGLVGTSVRTIAAGAYWPGELVDAFKVQLDAGEIALGGVGTFTLTESWGESGTGLLTVDHAGTDFAITWGSTDLRNALGFTTDIASGDVYTTAVQADGVWLPGAIMAAPRYRDNGHIEHDRTLTVSPRGHVNALGYESRQRTGRILWSHVEAKRAIESQEVTVGQSFECWWRDTHGGRVSYFGRAPLVRLYWDAGAGTYVEIRLIEPAHTFNPERVVPDWIGYWPVAIDGYVVPS